MIIGGSVEGRNHRGRPSLEYNQQIIKDQGYNSNVEIKGKRIIEKNGRLTANQSTGWNHRKRERGV